MVIGNLLRRIIAIVAPAYLLGGRDYDYGTKLQVAMLLHTCWED
jgi:hypothetical protein